MRATSRRRKEPKPAKYRGHPGTPQPELVLRPYRGVSPSIVCPECGAELRARWTREGPAVPMHPPGRAHQNTRGPRTAPRWCVGSDLEVADKPLASLSSMEEAARRQMVTKAQIGRRLGLGPDSIKALRLPEPVAMYRKALLYDAREVEAAIRAPRALIGLGTHARVVAEAALGRVWPEPPPPDPASLVWVLGSGA